MSTCIPSQRLLPRRETENSGIALFPNQLTKINGFVESRKRGRRRLRLSGGYPFLTVFPGHDTI
jgi:hypothetical protein